MQLTFKPQSSIRFMHADTELSFLIDKTAKKWYLDLIDAIFIKDEAAIIKEIPLSPYTKLDRLIWRCTTLGELSVNSAYHLITELDNQKLGQSFKQPKIKDSWTQIWQLGIPNASKTFLFRACLNALPTRANLVKRKIVEDRTCLICKQQPETTKQILWTCPSTRDMWG